MLRRLCKDQPEEFKFNTENLSWAKNQKKKYPRGRQQSAVIPLLFKAQEQEGWVSKPAIEYIAKFLDMAPIRVFEVASFYFMFHLSPVGTVAHIQVCGTTPCMLRGSEGLISECRKKISETPMKPCHDGKISWEEVECLGACSNAPVVQIGSDYFEDLDPQSFSNLIDNFLNTETVMPGSKMDRFSSEPFKNLTSLKKGRIESENASVSLFVKALKKKTGTSKNDKKKSEGPNASR